MVYLKASRGWHETGVQKIEKLFGASEGTLDAALTQMCDPDQGLLFAFIFLAPGKIVRNNLN